MAIGPSVFEEANSAGGDYALPLRPDNCFHCGEFVTNGERPWAWVGHLPYTNSGVGALIMHQHCLLDWLPRVLKDAEKIAQTFVNAGVVYGITDGKTKK